MSSIVLGHSERFDPAAFEIAGYKHALSASEDYLDWEISYYMGPAMFPGLTFHWKSMWTFESARHTSMLDY